MPGIARQWFSQRRIFLRLLTIALMVPAFLFGFSSVPSLAQAAPVSGWATIPGHMVPALKGLLSLRSSATNRQLQLAIWSNPNDTQRSPNGAGGGLSTFFARPFYQTGPGVDSTTMRHVPNVSADADPASGYAVFCTVSAAGCPASGNVEVGGTSAAAPLWAGVATDTNAFLASQGKSSLGNVNAELYTLFNTSQSFTAYHDVTVGNNLHFNATAGYDLASGIGTPNVWNFAREVPGVNSGGNNFSLSPNPSSLSIAQLSYAEAFFIFP